MEDLDKKLITGLKSLSEKYPTILTQKAIAEATGLSRKRINELFNGHEIKTQLHPLSRASIQKFINKVKRKPNFDKET